MRALISTVLLLAIAGPALACPPNSRCIGERLSPEEVAARERAAAAREAERAARERAAAADWTGEDASPRREAARTGASAARRPNGPTPCTEAQWWDGKTDCARYGF